MPPLPTTKMCWSSAVKKQLSPGMYAAISAANSPQRNGGDSSAAGIGGSSYGNGYKGIGSNIRVEPAAKTKVFVLAGEDSDSAVEIPDSPFEAEADITDAITALRYVKTIGQVELPETGDEANLILWSALAVISVIGMLLIRKKKEA